MIKNLSKKLAVFTICSLLVGGSSMANAESVAPLKPNVEKEKFENVKFLQTPADMGTAKKEVSNNALEKYKKAMEIVEDFFAEQGITVSGDLDDTTYQDQVISLGSVIESFKDSEKNLVLKFVKFMDYYENYDINDRIAELKEKNNEGSLTEEEAEELISYTPADANSTSGSNTIVFETATVYANGYDNIKARDYAYLWTSNSSTLRNNSAYPYYSNYYDCYSCWNDCTNFVSQAIKAGGMKYRDSIYYGASSSVEWYYSNSKPSYTWGGAHNFYLHWKNRAGVVSYVSSLQTGDVVNADFGGDGHIDHTAIITYNSGSYSSNKWLTQHTSDKEELTTLANWYNSGYKVYGYEMDKASN